MYTCMHTRLRYRHCANVLGQFFLLLAFSYMCSTRPLMRLVRVSACVRGDVCLRVCTHSPIILLFLSFKAVSSKYRSPKSSSLLEHHAQDCFFFSDKLLVFASSPSMFCGACRQAHHCWTDDQAIVGDNP